MNDDRILPIVNGIIQHWPQLQNAAFYSDAFNTTSVFNADPILYVTFWNSEFYVRIDKFQSERFEYTPEGSQKFFAFLEDYIPKRMQELLLKD